ncbi:MAG: NUDIX hydrolase [Candidatus Competibacteraceae bacterium]|nr:NUDIX hydrolase [Candidatus Competibacteraceae bacterium]
MGETVFSTPGSRSRSARRPGSEDSYYSLVRSNGVICFILTHTGQVVLVRQYRPPLGRLTLEMPAGGIESDETPAQAVARELAEEVGYGGGHLVYIGPCRVMINREDVVEHFFVCIGAVPLPGANREAGLETCCLSRAELESYILADRFDQTVALGGLFHSRATLSGPYSARSVARDSGKIV